MSYTEQDNFFAQAYRTGTDAWTAIPFERKAHELGLYLPQGALILDLGAGRGRLLFDFAELGYRAIGLENNPSLVARGNNLILEKGLDKELRFMQGDALDIPLSDQSFDGMTDIGLLQHILPSDYPTYVSETARVLKQGGFFFLIVLSKNSPNFLSWKPQKSETADFEKEGVHYHFFTDEEITKLFEKDFEIRHIDHDTPFGVKDVDFAVVLLKKK
jgi:ubiquinone/menaquinone biosynthesis C-methylase UbiE